jgi:hypothetical protein
MPVCSRSAFKEKYDVFENDSQVRSHPLYLPDPDKARVLQRCPRMAGSSEVEVTLRADRLVKMRADLLSSQTHLYSHLVSHPEHDNDFCRLLEASGYL